MLKTVAVIGANGYVGREICNALYLNNAMPNRRDTFGVFEVTRDNYDVRRRERITNPPTAYHILINCAMPGKRLWANENPEKDYIETVKKTEELLTTWSYNKFIQISTISSRCESDTVYGSHRLESEKLCQTKAKDSLIIRLTAMYSENISRGSLFDILHGNNVYISGDSRFSFTPLKFVGSWITNNLEKSGVIELGAKNTITLKEIADYLKVNIQFGDRIDVQEVLNPEIDFPDARDVLLFMENMYKNMKEKNK